MLSYTNHRRLTAQITELADILATESRQLRDPDTPEHPDAHDPLARSNACLRRALGALIMAIAALPPPKE